MITAMEINDSFGMMVRLTYYPNPTRRAMMRVRTWETWLAEELNQFLGHD